MRDLLYRSTYIIPGAVIVALLTAALLIKLGLCMAFGRRA